MIIGFTGTRIGMSATQKKELKHLLHNYKHHTHYRLELCEFHHGDCVGADEEAHEIANAEGYWIVTHPPKDTKARAFQIAHCEKQPKPYLDRNHDIVDVADIIIAAPRSMQEALRSGTWATVRYARKANKQVILLERENKWNQCDSARAES